MFKKILLTIAILLPTSAFAKTYVSLGGAVNAAHCSQIAGNAGYASYRFGGYVNGIYYWNACLGVVQGGISPIPNQYTYLRGSVNATQCSFMAGNAGYAYYRFGGYLNGVYYWNACFGRLYNPIATHAGTSNPSASADDHSALEID